MSYYGNSYQNYSGLYGNTYNPNNLQQNVQYQQPINGYNQNYNLAMNHNLDSFPSYFVDSYEQVRQASVASDGTPSIFISNVEDRFWLKKTNTENGRTIVKTFTFTEDTEEQNKNNSTILSNSQNSQNTDFIKKEELNNLLAPILNEMNMIKEAIFNSANAINNKEQLNNNNTKENKLVIPD